MDITNGSALDQAGSQTGKLSYKRHRYGRTPGAYEAKLSLRVPRARHQILQQRRAQSSRPLLTEAGYAGFCLIDEKAFKALIREAVSLNGAAGKNIPQNK